MCCKGKSSPILAFVWKVVRLREYVYFFICAALCQLVLNMCFLVLIFVIALCVYMIVDCGLAFVDFLSRAFNTQNETTAARNAANEKKNCQQANTKCLIWRTKHRLLSWKSGIYQIALKVSAAWTAVYLRIFCVSRENDFCVLHRCCALKKNPIIWPIPF